MKTYNDLIYKVHKVSVVAATFLQNKARDMPGFVWDDGDNGLASAFCWSDTPQGLHFWDTIDEAIKMKTFLVRVKDLRLVDYYVSAETAEAAEDKVAESLDCDEDFDHKTIEAEWDMVLTEELR